MIIYEKSRFVNTSQPSDNRNRKPRRFRAPVWFGSLFTPTAVPV